MYPCIGHNFIRWYFLLCSLEIKGKLLQSWGDKLQCSFLVNNGHDKVSSFVFKSKEKAEREKVVFLSITVVIQITTAAL